MAQHWQGSATYPNGGMGILLELGKGGMGLQDCQSCLHVAMRRKGSRMTGVATNIEWGYWYERSEPLGRCLCGQTTGGCQLRSDHEQPVIQLLNRI